MILFTVSFLFTKLADLRLYKIPLLFSFLFLLLSFAFSAPFFFFLFCLTITAMGGLSGLFKLQQFASFTRIGFKTIK